MSEKNVSPAPQSALSMPSVCTSHQPLAMNSKIVSCIPKIVNKYMAVNDGDLSKKVNTHSPMPETQLANMSRSFMRTVPGQPTRTLPAPGTLVDLYCSNGSSWPKRYSLLGSATSRSGWSSCRGLSMSLSARA